jgi:hypothetical protein
MSTQSPNIVIELTDDNTKEKYANDRRYALYRWRYNEVLEMHEPPLSFEKQPDRWMCFKWGEVDVATKRKINYFNTLKRMEALYITHIPTCCSATFMITKNGLYCIRNYLDDPEWIICPIYVFDEELTVVQIKLLEQLKKFSLGDELPTIKVQEVITITKKGITQKYVRGNESACRRFESILRLIPGSYKNGPWKQLDGFFGVYYHSETQELTEIFPNQV